MVILLYLIPLTALVGVIGLFILFWMVTSGQFDDMERSRQSILYERDTPRLDGAGYGKNGAADKN